MQDVVSHIYCLQVLFFFRILIVAPFTQLDNISWRLRELFQLYIFGNIYKEFRRLSDSIINIKSVLQNILLGGSAVVWYMIYSGWQKLRGSTGGTRQKVWTRTKILSLNIRYFVAN